MILTIALGLLGVVFVTLKLAGKINWSWWWVTAPFWVWPAITIVILGAMIYVGHFLNEVKSFL